MRIFSAGISPYSRIAFILGNYSNKYKRIITDIAKAMRLTYTSHSYIALSHDSLSFAIGIKTCARNNDIRFFFTVKSMNTNIIATVQKSGTYLLNGIIFRSILPDESHRAMKCTSALRYIVFINLYHLFYFIYLTGILLRSHNSLNIITCCKCRTCKNGTAQKPYHKG